MTPSLTDTSPAHFGMWSRRDWMLVLAFAILGGLFGVWVLFQNNALYFYQSYMPELVYSACGSGFVHPAAVPQALSNFLSVRATSFDCSQLDRSLAPAPSGLFLRGHLYLASAVAALWQVSSISYRSLWPLVSLLVGAYGCGCFVLLRLFFGRKAAAVGAVILTLSPVMLSMTIYLRDYGKAPFFVWAIVLLLSAARARSLRATLLFATAAGAVVGTGFGFRSDVFILLPIGVLFLAVGLGPRAWLRRAGGCAVFVGAAILLASPMLRSGAGAGGSGFLLMEGLSEPFRTYLDLGATAYDFGNAYSDELTLSSIAAELRPADPDWDAHEGAPFQSLTQSVTRSTGYVCNWLPFFAGDLATQAIKSAGWIVGFPALVASSRRGIDPGGPVRSGPWAAQPLYPLYNLIGRTWVPWVCLLGLIVFFWRVDTANPREALALLLMLGALLAYPTLQFSTRHVFHLEFIWVVAVLSLVQLPFQAVGWRSVSGRFATCVVAIGVAIFAVRGVLTSYQDRSLTKQFDTLQSQPRELVTDRPTGTRDGNAVFTVPLPERYRSLVEAPFDSMVSNMGVQGQQADVRAAADRLLMTFGGPDCRRGKPTMSVRYAKRAEVWQPFDHDVTVETPDDGGVTTVLIPAFYRPTQYLSGIEVPMAQAGCLIKIERVTGTTVLPVILTAILPPGWQQQPLHRGLGGFSVSGTRVR